MEKKKVKRKSYKRTSKKIEQKANNYRVILLLLALVIGITFYVKHKEASEPEIIDTALHNISSKDMGDVIEETELIKELRKITNGGDTNTFIIYQSMYTNEPVTLSSLNTENILYLTYKYIEQTYDLSQYNQFLTCDIASKVDMSRNITQCGGSKYSLSTFQYNTFITKDLLKRTAEAIFNVNLKEFKSFYTNEDNICHYVNKDYICISKKIQNTEPVYQREFVKAHIYENKIEIVENYYYIKDGIKHKYFKSKEEGSSLFISTYEKTNGIYHWVETKPVTN